MLGNATAMHVALQWGPDLVIGERSLGRPPHRSSRIQLQWGPDLVIGESRYVRSIALAMAGLQWGPDLVIGESCEDSYEPPEPDMLQWGPDLVIGESSGLPHPLRLGCRFNGAPIW